MIYADMHCDTLTVCRDGGHNVRENDLQASLQKLKDGGCAAQCFALFTEGRNSAADFERYLAFYKQAARKRLAFYSFQNIAGYPYTVHFCLL